MGQKTHRARRAWTMACVAGLGGFLLGGAAWAFGGGGCGHDLRLDQADENLEKAYVLIHAAVNEGVDPPFGYHDVLAMKAITLARAQVARAILYSEEACDD